MTLDKTKILIIISGPTAVGKTAVAVAVARHFGSEIVSADSRQIYREMRIGTAVPSPQELAAVKHHFIQTKSISDYYNAFMYETEVLDLLPQLFRRMNPVVMAGGSGLYIDAVCYGIDDIPTVDPAVRQQMKEFYEREGLEGLQRRLREVDPDYYTQVDLHNPKRLLKALEISVQSGRPYSSFLTRTRKERPFRILKAGLDLPREELYDRINRRVLQMMEEGLVEEARTLLPHRRVNALNTVGYKEIFEHLEGKLTLDEAVERIQANTRKYARKQLTWFRKDPEIRWFRPEESGKIIEWIEKELPPPSLPPPHEGEGRGGG